MPPSKSSPSIAFITKSVVISQMLFTAGHSLTTGGFLYYFVYEFSAFRSSPFLLAALQIAPESCEALSLFTRQILRFVKSRKWLWVSCLMLARITALLIPATLLFDEDSKYAAVLILGAVAVWHLLQGIAYCSYISWLSDLVPEMNWGRFFAKRKIASLSIAIIVPISAGLARKAWINGLPDVWKTRSFAAIFIVGAALVIASILPMLWIPDRAIRIEQKSAGRTWGDWASLFRSQFGWLLASRWWLAFFQGLTQAVIFKFSVDLLKISLNEYYILLAAMLSLQMATSWYAGLLCDRGRDRQLLIWSLIGVSFAMFFWMAATPETKWMAGGAYLLWGGFGFVNIALQNLTLKLAPSGDNTLHISLSRQGSGLVAGFAGLLGGLWLQELLENSTHSELRSYQLIFLISWLGRLSAAFWLIPLQQPDAEQKEETTQVPRRADSDRKKPSSKNRIHIR
ncbi:MFS transporter [Thalassoglobus polymorphus]|nr:MFS transporter [Thalassoglobus polymorphus]